MRIPKIRKREFQVSLLDVHGRLHVVPVEERTYHRAREKAREFLKSHGIRTEA